MWKSTWLLLGLIACREQVPGGQCGQDADCGQGQVCLFDLDRATTYCTTRCSAESPCNDGQVCRLGTASRLSGAPESAFCVDPVRSCEPKELCNGLDDDCDGVVDSAGCEVITNCLDDRPCGLFRCQPVARQPSAICAPANEDALVGAFERCQNNTDCENGVCETGWCSPLCRPFGNDCPTSISVAGNRREVTCARAVGDRERPPYNSCQIACASPQDCPEGLACTWREIYQAEPNHRFVCSLLDPNRKPLGAECPNNRPDDGDDQCQHGLCFGNVCTRICGGPGTSCADVGPDFSCLQRPIFYGAQEFAAFLCVRGGA